MTKKNQPNTNFIDIWKALVKKYIIKNCCCLKPTFQNDVLLLKDVRKVNLITF